MRATSDDRFQGLPDATSNVCLWDFAEIPDNYACDYPSHCSMRNTSNSQSWALNLDRDSQALKPVFRRNFLCAARIHRDTNFFDIPVLHCRFALVRFQPAFRSPLVRRRQGKWSLRQMNLNERNSKMANALGYVSETETGFQGSLSMMNLTASIRFETNTDKTKDGDPDYRIFAGETSTEIGGGWRRKAKASGRDYVSITFADPQIGPRKIYANLAPVKGKEGRHVILWNPRD